MKTKLYIVRHTQTTGNVERRLTGRCDYEITEDGKKYVEKMTQVLKNISFASAYASTSRRTEKTIEKLAEINGIQIKELDGLCEMYFGIYDGMKWEDVNKINPRIHELHMQTNEIKEIPEQEATEAVANRMYETISEIAMENLGKNVLICSHGVAIEAFLRKVTGVPFTQMVDEYSQKNTSINIVEYDEQLNKFKVLELNKKNHLEIKKESHSER